MSPGVTATGGTRTTGAGAATGCDDGARGSGCDGPRDGRSINTEGFCCCRCGMPERWIVSAGNEEIADGLQQAQAGFGMVGQTIGMGFSGI